MTFDQVRTADVGLIRTDPRETLVDRFGSLFLGGTEAFGTDTGGCVRTDGPGWVHNGGHQRSWEGLYLGHLEGRDAIGVYPLRYMDPHEANKWGCASGCVCRWGCVDLDLKGPNKPMGDYDTEADAHVAAQNLVAALQQLHITGWIERTRSNGRHVWVFAEDWCPARTMRRCLLVGCEVAGVPATEVNPKSETLAEGQVGNYVRLPYPGGLVDPVPTRRVMLDLGECISLGEFLDMAEQTLATPAVLAAAAALWHPPASSGSVDLPGVVNTPHMDVIKRLNGLAYTIFVDGALEGGDRSSTLMKLAYECRQSGLTPGETLNIVAGADRKIGKYVGRVDADERYRRTVERAYS